MLSVKPVETLQYAMHAELSWFNVSLCHTRRALHDTTVFINLPFYFGNSDFAYMKYKAS